MNKGFASISCIHTQANNIQRFFRIGKATWLHIYLKENDATVTALVVPLHATGVTTNALSTLRWDGLLVVNGLKVILGIAVLFFLFINLFFFMCACFFFKHHLGSKELDTLFQCPQLIMTNIFPIMSSSPLLRGSLT